jgi:hypothetical protein
MFNPAQPETWTPREARNAVGTLLCICGAPGREFFVDGVELIGGKEYGVLRGACSEEHWRLYRRHMRPEVVEDDPAPTSVPVSGFGPLFAGLEVSHEN